MKYHIRATQTDPPCLNEAGEALANKMEKLDQMKSAALDLSSQCELTGISYWPDQLQDLAQELADAATEIEEELADDLVE